MPILKTFCDALRQAILDYEMAYQDKGKQVPLNRQKEIIDLRTTLDNYENDPLLKDSVKLRQHLLTYVRNIPVGIFSFIPAFDSQLRRKLQSVLDEPRFSNTTLSAEERIDIRSDYTNLINFLTEELNKEKLKVKKLRNELKAEQAKDHVKITQEALQNLKIEKQQTALLTAENNQLKESFLSTKAQYHLLYTAHESLKKEHADLQEKYHALLQQRESIPHSHQTDSREEASCKI